MLLHADNFSLYGDDTALMTQGVYTTISGCTLVIDPDGVSPSRVLRPNRSGNETENWRFASPTGEINKIGVAMRVWNQDLPSNDEINATFMSWRTVANQRLCDLGVGSNGAIVIRVYTQNGAATIYKAQIPSITAKAWWHIEASYETIVNSNAANIEVRVEGRPVLVLNAVLARNLFPAQIAAFYTAPFNVQEYFIKDLVIWNSAGMFNNNFLGSVLVASLVPNSDVSLNWMPTPTGSTGFGILDNAPPNDAQFIAAEDDPRPAPYIGGMTDLPEEATNVRGIVTFVRAAKSDGGDGSLQVGLISSGDIALGENRPITVAQTYWRDVFETDPDTLAPWLPSAVNMAQLRIDRTA